MKFFKNPQNHFSKIRNFEKFLKNHQVPQASLPAERGSGDHTLCVCVRMGEGYEVCHTVLHQYITWESTRARFYSSDSLKNRLILRNLTLGEVVNSENLKYFPWVSPLGATEPWILDSGIKFILSKSCTLFFPLSRLWQP